MNFQRFYKAYKYYKYCITEYVFFFYIQRTVPYVENESLET